MVTEAERAELELEKEQLKKEMRPIGERLFDLRPLTRAVGRTQYAKKHGYDKLKEIDNEYNKLEKDFNKKQKRYKEIWKKLNNADLL